MSSSRGGTLMGSSSVEIAERATDASEWLLVSFVPSANRNDAFGSFRFRLPPLSF